MAVRGLSDEAAAARLCLVEEGKLTVVAADGGWDSPGDTWLIGPTTAAALLATPTAGVFLVADMREDLRLGPEHDHAHVLGLSLRGDARGLLVVSGAPAASRALRSAQHGALRALATQIALALESAALSEEVHRRRSEARFGSLVQHSSDLITVLGPDGRVNYQSPSIERVLGYVPEEIVGSSFSELIEMGDRSRLVHLGEAAVAGSDDGLQAIECTLVHKDGGTRQFEILMTNLLDEEHVGGIVLNARD